LCAGWKISGIVKPTEILRFEKNNDRPNFRGHCYRKICHGKGEGTSLRNQAEVYFLQENKD